MSKEVWGYHEHPKRREPDWEINPQTAAVREGLARSGFGETSEALYLNSGYTYADSQEAVDLAIKYWVYTGFIVKDYLHLTKEFIGDFDLVHLGALLDVLPNGDEALEFILSLEPRYVLIGRMKLTNEPSFYETYTAYDEITTCGYHHNRSNFIRLCEKYGYEIMNIDNNFYLTKIELNKN